MHANIYFREDIYNYIHLIAFKTSRKGLRSYYILCTIQELLLVYHNHWLFLEIGLEYIVVIRFSFLVLLLAGVGQIRISLWLWQKIFTQYNIHLLAL
jgi:hypothetical protein